ncbi:MULTISPECIES: DMT family transporter [unclassified Brevundimonas]|uniref:DMT family transporter n=1 Tax=unclassified Brevundimonas TaxID=2622653 RepID=UPI0025C5349D|nr:MULTISPECIES: DMT family transporter [unclassified Brevundimonas]
MTVSSARFWGVLSGLGAGAMWGLVFLAPKLAPEASPFLMSAGRYIAYGLIAALLIAPRWKRLKGLLDRQAWLALVWLSLAGNVVYYLFLVVSVHYAGVAASALIVGAVPVVVALWGLRDQNSPPLIKVGPPIAVAALAIGLIGYESIMRGQLAADATGLSVAIGLVSALIALALWTAYAVGNSRWMVKMTEVSSHDWSLLIGVVTGALSLLLVPMAVLTLGDLPAGFWPRFLLISFGIAVLASVVGNAFWNRASRLLPLTMLGQMIVFETLFAFLYGFIWEQRGPTVIEIVSMILMVVSVIWCVRAHRPAAEAVKELEA